MRIIFRKFVFGTEPDPEPGKFTVTKALDKSPKLWKIPQVAQKGHDCLIPDTYGYCILMFFISSESREC